MCQSLSHVQLFGQVWVHLTTITFSQMDSDPMDSSLPSSSVHGTLQIRILEWVAILLSRGSFLPRD